MEKYITKEMAENIEFTLKNSREQEVTLSLWDAIQHEEECSDFCFFLVQLAQLPDPKDGDWMEVLRVPVFNGKENPETGENEFCPTYWDVKDGLYSTDVSVEKMFWHEGSWYHASAYRPPELRDKHWEDFITPLFK